MYICMQMCPSNFFDVVKCKSDWFFDVLQRATWKIPCQ